MKILDGGLGRELARRGAPFRQPEWSALALIEAPETVKEVHLDFINAGAEVITTNNYAVVPFHIGQERFETDGVRLIKVAIEQAKNAVKESGKNVKIAGCLPRYLVLTAPTCSNRDRLKILLSQLLTHWHQR
ncbi:Homocysteine S-methyltransferase [Acinetobacter baumannii]|nr:Homocysteine S-methyltransferase [Acinetobacter baumannii]